MHIIQSEWMGHNYILYIIYTIVRTRWQIGDNVDLPRTDLVAKNLSVITPCVPGHTAVYTHIQCIVSATLADYRLTTGWLQADYRPYTVGHFLWLTTGWLQADYRPYTAGHFSWLQADYRLTTGLILSATLADCRPYRRPGVTVRSGRGYKSSAR